MKIPSKVVAVEGRLVLVNIGNKVLEISQFEVTNLEDFSVEELEKAESLKEALKENFLVEFSGQKLPKRPTSKFTIPNMKVAKVIKTATSVSFQIVKHKRSGREADIECAIVIPEETMALIKKAQDVHKKQLLEEKEELRKVQEEELRVDTIVKKGKTDIPKIETVRIDNKEVIPLEKFKAPKSGKRAVKENTVKVNLDNKTVEK